MKKIGKIVLIGFVAMILLGGLLSACSKSSSSTASSGAAEAESSQVSKSAASESEGASAVSSEAIASEPSISSASASISSVSASVKKSKDGFDPDTNYTSTVAGVEFQIPSYFEQGEPKTSDKGAISRLYNAESGEQTEVFLFSIEQPGSGVTAESFDKAKDQVAEALANLNASIENTTITEKNDSELAGLNCRAFTARGTYKGQPVNQYWVFYWNEKHSSIGGIALYEVGDAQYDYLPDYKKVVDSAKAVELSDESAASGDGQAEQNASGEVSPDLKEMLDSYETFMDEYIEFMNSYKESGDTMSMLSQYTEYMQKYTDLVQKVEAVDTSNMSAADYAYYIEVTSRVSEKLLKVSML